MTRAVVPVQPFCNNSDKYIMACWTPLLMNAYQTSNCVMQELAAQGKLPPGKVMSFAKPGEDTATIFRDVYINDASPDMRHHMTKRPTQDDVARRTGTQVRAVTALHSALYSTPACNHAHLEVALASQIS